MEVSIISIKENSNHCVSVVSSIRLFIAVYSHANEMDGVTGISREAKQMPLLEEKRLDSKVRKATSTQQRIF